MAAPLHLEEGQSSTRPPCFNGHFYSWWKVRMHDYLMVEDSELWDIVLDGPFIPMMEKKDGEKTSLAPKPRQKYDEADRKKIENGYKAKTLLTAHEGTEQVKESKIDMLTSRMSKQVRKVLRILPKSWESKVDAIIEAKDLKVLTMDALIGNLKTHEMNRNYDSLKKESKKYKSLMLKYKSDEDSSDDDMAYLINRFQKIVRKNKVFKRGTNGTRNATQGDICYKCGKAGHFIRECPLLKNENKEHQTPRSDKEKRRDLVLGKRDRKAAADLVFKKALDMKTDLDNYSLKKLRTLAKIMIDSITEEAEKLNEMSNGLQVEIQEKLKNSEKNLGLSLEKSKKLEKDIVKLKEELEKSLKWTKSSKLLSNATNQKSMCNLLCLHYGKNGHLKGECAGWRNSYERLSNYAERQNLPKERPGPLKNVSTRRFSKKKSVTAPMSFVSERSSSQCWYMDSGCSKHMTGNVKNFLSLKTLQGGGVSFGDVKKGYILGVGKVEKSLEDLIDNVYHVDGLKYSLLSVSQICDKGNEVKFTSEKCTVMSLTTKKNENADLWHRRLGHVSSSLLNKLISKDLVRGLPKLKFAENKICEACVKGKQIRSSFKPKKQVTSSRTLELLHMDLCGPLKVQSRNGKKYILVIVDDYSRYTWTRFLKSKAETAEELVVFFKMIQTKLNQVICTI
ncbi:uncharacterized protein [Solanum lycopersicum]|uniref:uncharacterized protein n=1 Tax=Solanum lycopersicum TaxID=4081 RepID=UPI00374A4C55